MAASRDSDTLSARPTTASFVPPIGAFLLNPRVQVLEDLEPVALQPVRPVVGFGGGPVPLPGLAKPQSADPAPSALPVFGQYSCTGTNCPDVAAGTLAVMNASGWLAFGRPFTLAGGHCTPTPEGFAWTDGVRWTSWRRIG